MTNEHTNKHLEGQLPIAGEKRLWAAYYTYFEGKRAKQEMPDDPIRWTRANYGIRAIHDTVEQGKPIDSTKGC